MYVFRLFSLTSISILPVSHLFRTSAIQILRLAHFVVNLNIYIADLSFLMSTSISILSLSHLYYIPQYPYCRYIIYTTFLNIHIVAISFIFHSSICILWLSHYHYIISVSILSECFPYLVIHMFASHYNSIPQYPYRQYLIVLHTSISILSISHLVVYIICCIPIICV